MKRNIERDLKSWKEQKTRLPLLLKGARQVGKTYLLEQFGKKYFDNYHYFDFSASDDLHSVFETKSADKILQRLMIFADRSISIEKDLIILDEIQECSNALTSLKALEKRFPNAYFACSGSFLGVSLLDTSFPVGKVQRMELYPMNFIEFLTALKEEKLIKELMNELDSLKISTFIHNRALELLKLYFFVGGMPQVVKTYIGMDDKYLAFEKVRAIQRSIISDYRDDFAKYSGKINAVKIRSIYDNIPIQLAKEYKGNKKFIFKDVLRKNSNFINIEEPVEWLVQAGLVHKVLICNHAKFPLISFSKSNRFNLFVHDIGLLGAMGDIPVREIMEHNYGTFKGRFIENFVINELISLGSGRLFSWNEGVSEIELLLNIEGQTVPIEIKAGHNTKAKSLKVFQEKYRPSRSVLLSLNEMKVTRNRDFIPLYLTFSLYKTKP